MRAKQKKSAAETHEALMAAEIGSRDLLKRDDCELGWRGQVSDRAQPFVLPPPPSLCLNVCCIYLTLPRRYPVHPAECWGLCHCVWLLFRLLLPPTLDVLQHPSDDNGMEVS